MGAKAFNGHVAILGRALAATRDAVLVYRHQPNDDLTDVSAAIAALKGLRARNLYLEIRNEPPFSDGRGGTNWAIVDRTEAEIRAALPACRDAGVGLAALCLGTGQPEPEVWAYMAAHGWFGLDPARDIIDLHEYSFGGEIDGWNMGRFAKLVDAGWTGPILIGECGLDRCGQPGCGWRTAVGPWPGTEDAFYDLMARYDALLAQYPQVRLASVFSADGWPSFYFGDPRRQFNGAPQSTSGGTSMADTLEDRVRALEDRDALLTQALHRILTGEYTGATGAAADVVALQGGTDDLSGKVKVPTFG